MPLTDAERVRDFEYAFNLAFEKFEAEEIHRSFARFLEERNRDGAKVDSLSTELDLQCEVSNIPNLDSLRRVRCSNTATQAVRLFSASDELALFCEAHAAEGWLLGD
jgi:hypothetical protein